MLCFGIGIKRNDKFSNNEEMTFTILKNGKHLSMPLQKEFFQLFT
jgi:predicted lactoylglutathione lyase